jgi:hypothetical protein
MPHCSGPSGRSHNLQLQKRSDSPAGRIRHRAAAPRTIRPRRSIVALGVACGNMSPTGGPIAAVRFQDASHTGLACLAWGGDLGALIRAHNWANSLIGPPESWSPSLKMTVGFLLANRSRYSCGGAALRSVRALAESEGLGQYRR